jgi:YesN/AraC family two-component response regulator
MAVATPYIYIASYKGIMQPTIWQWQGGTKRETVQEEMQDTEKIEITIVSPDKSRPQKPKLNEDRIGDIARRITALMEEEKMYQQTELTLQQLADKIQIPAYQVSQVLNDGMKKSFYDLVNGYRVENAKRLLIDPKNSNYTILSVGFEAGFNSKTTFNTVFKKFTGHTPTDFREKQKVDTVSN